MGPIGSERIDRRVQFVLDRAAGRLPGYVIDRAADRIEPGHQRRRAFEKFDAVEIGRIHDARGDVLRTNPDSVVEDVDRAAGEAAHGKAGGRAGRVAGEHADRALRGFRGGPIALLAHRLLIDDFDACRRLEDGETQPARAGRHDIGVERGSRHFGRAGAGPGTGLAWPVRAGWRPARARWRGRRCLDLTRLTGLRFGSETITGPIALGSLSRCSGLGHGRCGRGGRKQAQAGRAALPSSATSVARACDQCAPRAYRRRTPINSENVTRYIVPTANA